MTAAINLESNYSLNPYQERSRHLTLPDWALDIQSVQRVIGLGTFFLIFASLRELQSPLAQRDRMSALIVGVFIIYVGNQMLQTVHGKSIAEPHTSIVTQAVQAVQMAQNQFDRQPIPPNRPIPRPIINWDLLRPIVNWDQIERLQVEGAAPAA